MSMWVQWEKTNT